MLGRRFSRIYESGQSHANQAVEHIGRPIYAFTQGAGDLSELLSGGGEFRKSEAAGQGMKVRCFQFEDYGAWQATDFTLCSSPGFFSQPINMRFELIQSEIAFKGIF